MTGESFEVVGTTLFGVADLELVGVPVKLVLFCAEGDYGLRGTS